jgi:urocanate hydratase
MANGVCLACDVEQWRIEKRLKSKYLDVLCSSFDEAIALAMKSKADKTAISIGVVGNAADFFKYVYDQGVLPDLVTDQTSAHDPLNGYVPHGISVEAALSLRINDPKKYTEKSYETMGEHVKAMLARSTCF